MLRTINVNHPKIHNRHQNRNPNSKFPENIIDFPPPKGRVADEEALEEAIHATRTPDLKVLALKRLMDIAVGTAGVALHLMIYPLVALLIKLESKGPVIYKQVRVGINRRTLRDAATGRKYPRKEDIGGVPFVIYKYRTMYAESELNGPQLWKKSGDPRVTSVGKWLRHLHLDEIPQFWNILKGDMSFIGPRPERPQFTVKYGKTISHYGFRTLQTKPGLTGLAQIILGYDESLESVVNKYHYDLSYSASLSNFKKWFFLELWILWNTGIYLFKRKGSRVNQMGLAGPDRLNVIQLKSTDPKEGVKPVGTTGIIRYRQNMKNQFISGLTPGEIHKKLDELGKHPRQNLEITLNPDSEFDLQDLGFLVNLVHKVKDAGGKLSIRNAHPRVSKVLKEIHMDKIVDLVAVRKGIPNFLTIDVECWFHAHNLKDRVKKGDWHLLEPRVVENVRRILELLKTHQATATFFVLGWVARHFPEVVWMIEEDGHEIGTHGYSHNLITEMTVEEFEEDLDKSLNAIGKLTHQRVTSFRASNFTVTQDTLWALKILTKYGIEADSSIFPIERSRYGIPNYPNRLPHKIQFDSGQTIFEYPMSTLEVGKKQIPMAGGGYLRLYPYRITDRFIEQVNLKGYPVMTYFHPWELDVDQERFKVPAMKRFQHYVNLHTTEWKLSKLLERFRFLSILAARKERRINNLLEANTVKIRGEMRDAARPEVENSLKLVG